MEFTKDAIDRFFWAKDKNILTDEKIDEIIDTVINQEIVSFSTCNGTVSFDIDDIISVSYTHLTLPTIYSV